jgi:hypothetical protein
MSNKFVITEKQRCATMNSMLAVVILGGAAVFQISVADAQSQVASLQSSLKSASASVELPALPPAPHGKSTVLGGEIRSVDPMRDSLTLKIFGPGPVELLFDERTQVYRDGKKIPLCDLVPPTTPRCKQC